MNGEERMEQETQKNTDIGFYIKKLDNHIQRHIHSLYDRKEFMECSLLNMRVADFLFDNQEKEIFQKDIEAEFFINRATASKMLTLMEEKKLIRRTNSHADARLKQVELLPKGMELHEWYGEIRLEMEDMLTQGLSEEEVTLFKTLCQKILREI